MYQCTSLFENIFGYLCHPQFNPNIYYTILEIFARYNLIAFFCLHINTIYRYTTIVVKCTIKL